MMLVVAYYFLSNAFPDLKIALAAPNISEADFLVLRQASDIVLVGSDDKTLIKSSDADVCFNSYRFSEVTKDTSRQYLDLLEDAKIPFLLHENFNGDSSALEDLLPSSQFNFGNLKLLQRLPMANPRNESNCIRELYFRSNT